MPPTSTLPHARPRSPFALLRRVNARTPWRVLAVVSAGGAVGATARYGVDTVLATARGGFGWGTFTVNVTGCLAIGVLMVLVTDVWPSRPLLRPFLGTGLLGGYTTFSTYVVDIQHLVQAGAARTALAYLAGTMLAALAAVYAGTVLTRLAVGRATRAGRTRSTR